MQYYIFYFFIYAIIGWILEVSFHVITKGRFVNRGFFNGPYCPIYGFGAIAVISILNVVGDSMIEAGILDGDKVIVRSQTIAENGDIIVAMTEENEATVKRFFKEKTHYRLQPENNSMDPIYLDQVTVLGKVVGLFREM